MFVLGKLVNAVLLPSNASLLLLLAGLVWHRRRFGRVLFVAVPLFWLALLVVPITETALARLEDRFADVPLPAQVDGIVVLGGDFDVRASDGRGRLQIGRGATRLVNMIELAERYPEARIVFAGGTGHLRPGELREADLAAAGLELFDFDPSRVVFERRSRTIWENVTFAKALVAPGPDEVWVVVTIARQMPRAIASFLAVDWRVVPYAVGFHTSGARAPASSGRLGWELSRLDFTTHEYLGLLAYRLLGRTQRLWPGPEDLAARRRAD